jgi:hypothetical protein
VEGSEGGRRSFISHFHVSPCMAVPGKPSARLSYLLWGLIHHLKLIAGQRLLRFSILKETPMAPIFIVGAAWKTASRQGVES